MIGSFAARWSRLAAFFFVVASSLLPFGDDARAASQPTADVVASWNLPQQTIDGFGAANVFLPNAMTSADADRFFSASAGIGLTILRVGISPTGGLFGGGWSDGALVAARGGRVIATPWSAPGAWKSNGSTTNGGTLLTSRYSDWASLMASFVGAFKANAGVSLYAVSLQNEPDLAESYESMLYSIDQLAAFAKVVSPTLAASSPRPKLMMGEYSTWDSLNALTNDLVGNDKTALGLVDVFGTHQYGSGVPTPYTASYPQPLWETEASSFDAFDPSLANGLGTAKWIHDALTTGGASAWLYWWLYGQNADNEGLVGSSDHPGQMTKRYYTLGNFSKFVRPGWVRLATTGNKTGIYGVSAFKNASTGGYAIVVVNASSAPVALTLGLSDAGASSSVVPYETYDDGSGDFTMSVHGNLAPQAAIAVASNGTFTATVPVGVTTFVGTVATPVVPATGGVGLLAAAGLLLVAGGFVVGRATRSAHPSVGSARTSSRQISSKPHFVRMGRDIAPAWIASPGLPIATAANQREATSAR
ncbi:MAG TPA: hypothetical protein VK989_14640 [Polyangia bacterium]|nr:hypothetical protein [Polyangia bacterium]